jgi:TolB-like protein
MTNDAPRSDFGRFLAELQRRHVGRFTLGYAAAAFVALQLAEIVFPAFGIGEGAIRLLVVAVALGFLPAIVAAWLFDLTVHGIRRTQQSPTGEPEPRRMSALAFTIVATGILGGVTWYVLDQDVITTLAGTRAATFDPARPIRSLAVLPLDDFSAEGDQEYFAAGMHEELIARLSMLEGVRVVSRTSVMRYAGTTMSIPEIGRELGVDVVIEGSVNRSGDRVRITLQVIHAPSDSHITTLQFDREAGDVLALQTEVAHAVVHEIQGAHDESAFTLAAADVSPEAQEAYFRGKHEYERGTAEGYRAALDYFEAALGIDSAFAPAMAGLAGARFLLGMDDPGADASELVLARDEAIAALAMDSTSLEVREVLELIDRSLPAVAPAAAATLAEASATPVPTPPAAPPAPDLALDSTWSPAMTGLGQRLEQRMMQGSRSSRESTAATGKVVEARQLLAAGRYAEASPVLEGLVRASPTVSAAWDMLARSYIGAGNPAAAADAVRRWGAAGAPGAPTPQSAERLIDAVADSGGSGYWTWKLEELEAAEASGRSVSRTELAAAHAALGHSEEALALLGDAVAAKERTLFTLQTDPVWDDLRGDARFRDVERQAQQLRFVPALTYAGRRGRPAPR